MLRGQLAGREGGGALAGPLQPVFDISPRNWLDQLLARIVTEKMSTDHFNCYGRELPANCQCQSVEPKYFLTETINQPRVPLLFYLDFLEFPDIKFHFQFPVSYDITKGPPPFHSK